MDAVNLDELQALYERLRSEPAIKQRGLEIMLEAADMLEAARGELLLRDMTWLPAKDAEIEALRDELIALRRQVRAFDGIYQRVKDYNPAAGTWLDFDPEWEAALQSYATAIQERDAALRRAERAEGFAQPYHDEAAALRQRNEELTAALGLLREAYIGAKRMRQSDFDDIDRLLKEQS